VADSGAWTSSAHQVNQLEAIRDAVTASYPQAPFTSPPEGTKFTVEMIFRMTPEELARAACDLDNFAKPVLDTPSGHPGSQHFLRLLRALFT
jgi:hypothetical protein